MDLLSPNPDDFTEAEHDALREGLGGDEDQITEFAVIYYRKGKPEVEGPYDRRLAERKADATARFALGALHEAGLLSLGDAHD